MHRHIAPLFFVFSLATYAQSGKHPGLVAWNDTTLADSIRAKGCYDYIWEEVLFSDPDSAYAMAIVLRDLAHTNGAVKDEASAIGILGTVLYVKGELPEALAEHERSLRLYQQAHSQEGVADALTNMGGMQYFQGMHTEALDLYGKGLVVHEQLQDSVGMANDLNAMGAIHMARGDHARALDHYARSFHLLEILGDKRGMATGYANLGALSLLQGDTKGALSQYTKALHLAHELNDLHLIGKELENVGSSLLELGDTTSAMDHFQRSLATREGIPDQHGIVSASNAIGAVLLAQGRTTEAMARFATSMDIAEREGLSYGWAVALVGAGNTRLCMGRPQEALELARKARRLAADAEEVALERDAVELEYTVLKSFGRMAEALAMHEYFIVLRDSVANEETQREVMRSEYAYAYGKQMQKDSLEHANAQREQALVHDRDLTRERYRTWISVGIGVALLALLVAIASRARLLKRTNIAIKAAQQQLVASEKRREAEQVRTRIALDVHDDLGSDLTRIGLLGSELHRRITSGSTGSADIAHQLSHMTRTAGTALSDIVWAVDPERDTAAMLVVHARTFAERALADTGITTVLHFDHEGPDRPLDPSVKRDIFLVMKEAINNAIKHASPSRIEVVLNTGPNSFDLKVIDNGRGFEPSARVDGNGVRNLHKRAQRICARLEIKSDPQSGTCIHLSGPLG